MKKVKLVKKALLPAVIAVFCSLVALTSVSYAWFTLGNTASVDTIDVNVQAADGIQISANASSWKSVLPLKDLQDVEGNEMPTGEIAPVSTGGVVANGKMQMFIGEVQNDGKTLITESQVESGSDNANFFAFDIYVKLDNAKEFQLDIKSNVYAGDKANNSEIAARVAFINLGTAETAAAAKDLNGAAEDVVIWEPNAKKHVEAEVGVENGNAVSSYYGVIKENANGFDMTKGADDSTNLQLVETKQYDYDANGTTAANTLFELGAGYSKIRVYIWLEGQDVDCTNNISGGNFKVDLKFVVPEE